MTVTINGTAGIISPGYSNTSDFNLLSVQGAYRDYFGNAISTYGHKNKIINGCCRINQRGSVAVTNNASSYGGCDRIFVYPLSFTTATGNIAQYNGVATKSGSAQGVPLTTTGTGSLYFGMALEATDTITLNGKTVTFTATVYQNTGGNISVTPSISKANTVNNFGSITTLGFGSPWSIPSGTPTDITFTMSIGASDASNGLLLYIAFASIGAITAKDFWVGNLQLEEGSMPTPFDMKPYNLEYILCQRYYQTGTWHMRYTGSTAGQILGGKAYFKTFMRTVPTIVSTPTLGTVSATSVFADGIYYEMTTAANGQQVSVSYTATAEL